MTEAAFPLLGAAFVILAVLPASALVAKLALLVVERRERGAVLHGLNVRFLLLTGASAVPLAWFFSAGLHQTESGVTDLACLLAHEGLCFEPGFFSLLLALGVALACFRSVRRGGRVQPSRSVRGAQLELRLRTVLRRTASLEALSELLVVTDEPGFAIGTRGTWRPRVFVGVDFAKALTDDMLASALHHELQHVHSRDPLRYLLLDIAMTVNPFGRFLLEPHVARWKAAREAHCDREAVLSGADALALAEAIVRAARPSPREAAALGYADVAVLKLRVSFLVAFAERRPERCCRDGYGPIPAVITLLVFALMLPHQAGTDALDAVHLSTEHVLAYLSR